VKAPLSREPDWLGALPSGVPGRVVEVDGRRVHVVERGAGDDAMLLVHGAAGTTLDWETSVLDTFATRRRVVAVDLFGMGFSERVGPPIRFATRSRQLAGTLDALGIERAKVVGQSLGGAVVGAFAGTFPERVTHLVSVDSGPWVSLAMIPMLVPPYVTWLANRRGYWPARPDQGRAYEERLRAVYRVEGTRRDLAAFIRGQFVDGRSYFAALARVECPTLLVHGANDHIIPVRAARSLLRRIPGARLVVIDCAGHFSMQDEPEQFVAACEDFFAGRTAD
jgi:pimeloyl-ACP methyl ester carboxylesterase